MTTHARFHTRSVLAALLAAVSAGCLPDNQSGRVSALRTGDLSNPRAERLDPAVQTTGGCPPMSADTATGGTIHRRPHVQRVTSQGATLVWTSSAGEPATVVFRQQATGTARAQILTVPAIADVTALPVKGVAQWLATADGLSAGAEVCYEIHEGDRLVAAAGFHTAPGADSAAPVRLVAFGDSGGGGSDQAAVLRQLHTVPFDFILHTGDIAYPSATRAALQTRFFQPYADLLQRLPAFPAAGNHEYLADGAAPFREAFVLPENGGEAGFERWYSFDWGPVHLVALDTERTGDAQAAWLEADLAANRRPWVIVYGHKPPFSSGAHGGDGDVRRSFVPIFERHRVALVLSGHDHNYERTHAINGVTYVVTGGGGRGTRPVGSSSFTAFSADVLHVVHVRIAGDALSVHAIDATGLEFDGAVVRR